MIDRNRIELLAPAGNMDCLKGAVENGADAVYFAGKLFGARSYADNFSYEEMIDAVNYCHLRGVRVYITVNTLVSDREIPEAMEYLKFLNQIGVDAVIVQDFGLAKLIKENFPYLPIHGSTQMSVHNAEGVLTLEKMGIKQVVLSRELSIKEIEEIKSKTNAKLEVFAHGALCMSYSGQCLLSSVLGGRSGNRGKCAQPCRLEYKINNNQKGYYMSLKDLCSLNHIKELENIGVSSLKIEGRMKGKEYVSAVVEIYRKYIDLGIAPDKEDLERLNRIFFRGGLTDGYLTGKQGEDMFCFDKPDNPYEKQNKEGKQEGVKERKQKLSCYVKITEGCYPEIEIEGNGIKVSYIGEQIIEKSEKRPLEMDFVREKIGKTGGTTFEFENIRVEFSGSPFMSVGALNELRRNALLKYEEEFLKGFKREGDYEIPEIAEKNREEVKLVCKISREEQFDMVLGYDFKEITVPIGILLKNTEKFLPHKDKIVIEPPAIIKKWPKKLEELRKMGFSKILVNNIGMADIEGFEKIGGFRLNVFNSQTLGFLKEKGFRKTALSPEMKLASIRDMKKLIKTEVMVYGHQPLMITENCIIRNGGRCPCGNEINYITDRKGIQFPVIKDGENCRSVLLNSTPTFMGDKLDEIIKSGAEDLMLYFTIENKREVQNICNIFFRSKGEVKDYTRLHYYRGVL